MYFLYKYVSICMYAYIQRGRGRARARDRELESRENQRVPSQRQGKEEEGQGHKCPQPGPCQEHRKWEHLGAVGAELHSVLFGELLPLISLCCSTFGSALQRSKEDEFIQLRFHSFFFPILTAQSLRCILELLGIQKQMNKPYSLSLGEAKRS